MPNILEVILGAVFISVEVLTFTYLIFCAFKAKFLFQYVKAGRVNRKVDILDRVMPNIVLNQWKPRTICLLIFYTVLGFAFRSDLHVMLYHPLIWLIAFIVLFGAGILGYQVEQNDKYREQLKLAIFRGDVDFIPAKVRARNIFLRFFVSFYRYLETDDKAERVFPREGIGEAEGYLCDFGAKGFSVSKIRLFLTKEEVEELTQQFSKKAS